MELSKQEMEIFLLFSDLQSKKLFYKKFLAFKKESNFFYKIFLAFENESKTGLKTGNRITQTGNGIISPTF